MVNSFTPITTLRYWCQKVIPLVYEDSLSYYELLSKIIAKLNEVIENSNKQDTAIESVISAVTELQYYVEHYLDTVDFQEMVNNKLEEMLNDGSLENLMLNNVVSWNMNFGGTISGKPFARERYNYYEVPTDQDNSRTQAIQNATIYSPSGNYELDGSQKYMYYWKTWSDNQNTFLITYDINARRVTNRMEVANAGHGGEMHIKDGKLYTLNCADGTQTPPARVFVFDLSNPSTPRLESSTLLNNDINHLIGWYEEENSWLGLKVDSYGRHVYKLTPDFLNETYLYDLESNTQQIIQDYHFDDEYKVIYSISTYSNTIQMNSVLNGKALTSIAIPDVISYINTGECEWICVHGNNLYFGGQSQNGCRNSIQTEFASFYCNANTGRNVERRINYTSARQRTVNVSKNADDLNRTYADIGGNNLVFKYIEDAFNYAKEYGHAQISLITDYDYSFVVNADCRLNLNNKKHGAIIVDYGVTCMMTTLGGEFIGEPIVYNYSRDGVNQDISCYLYVSHGAVVIITSISNIPYNENADIMCWFNYCVVHITSNTALKHILLTDAQLISQGVVTEDFHSRFSLIDVRGVNVRYGDTQFIDLDSTVKGLIMFTDLTQTIRLNDLNNKYFCKPTALTGNSSNAFNGRPIGQIGIFGGNIATYNIAWGYWSSDTEFTRINYQVIHTQETSRLAGISAHRWQLKSTDDEFPSPIGGYGFYGRF